MNVNIAERAYAIVQKNDSQMGIANPHKKECGEVLEFCELYCNVQKNNDELCSFNNLYSTYEMWIKTKSGFPMPEECFKLILIKLYRNITFFVSPKGMIIRGMGFKDHYWEL